jgi:hypothetical protein
MENQFGQEFLFLGMFRFGLTTHYLGSGSCTEFLVKVLLQLDQSHVG